MSFNDFVTKQVELAYSTHYAQILNQYTQYSQNQLFNAAAQAITSTDSDPDSSENRTAVEVAYANNIGQTAYAGKRVIRPGDIVTVCGSRAF